MELSAFNIIVEPEVTSTSFACDLEACKGACCTLPGGRGAPLLDEEVDAINAAVPIVREHLSDSHREHLDAFGPVEGSPGDHHTTCIDNRACVFVTYEHSIARCSIEQAFFRGETSWRKPLSCHLFPIRIDRHPVPRMRFEYLTACAPALEQGTLRNTPLVTFVGDALKRAFGDAWPAFRERLTR
jgi:hypothetical protein